MNGLYLPCEINYDSHDLWLADRPNGLGASESGPALGISPYMSRFELYCLKTGEIGPLVQTDAMSLGKMMEPVIAKLYERRTGVPIVRREVSGRLSDKPFIRATLDGINAEGRLVEFKTANARSAKMWGESGTDEVPTHYATQVYQQMLVADAEKADVAVLIAGEDFRLYTLYRDADIERVLIDKLSEFWDRVQRRDPPETLMSDRDILCRLRPKIDDLVNLGSREAALADLYAQLGEESKVCADRRQGVKAELIMAMRDHFAATLPDGRVIRRKAIERLEYTVKPSSYIDFRILTSGRS